jgi:hypothetical protein
LLIVPLVVATASSAEDRATGALHTDDAVGRLLVATDADADATTAAATTSTTVTVLALLLAVVIAAVVRVMVLVMVVVLVRAAEKVWGTHVVLHVAVVVWR